MKRNIWGLLFITVLLCSVILFISKHLDTKAVVGPVGPAKTSGAVCLVELTKNEFTGGEQLDVTLKIQTTEAINIMVKPQLRIFKANQYYGEKPLNTYDLESWDMSSLKKGSEVERKVSVLAPVAPGYYRIEFADDSTKIGGGSADFFVQYPVGTVRLGTIPVNKTVEAFGRSLKVESITMTEKSTTVQYSLTPGVRSFLAELIKDDGNTLLQRGGIPFDTTTITQAQSSYEPIPISVNRLRFRLSHLQVFSPSEAMVDRSGEWEIEIPLN